MKADDVAGMLEKMADLLEIDGENRFKLRAYRRGAEILRERSDEFDQRLENGTLRELDGIGEALEDKIVQAVREGRIAKFDEVKQRLPVTLLELADIRGLGPKSIRKLYDREGVESLDDLERALETDRLKEIDGFGPKTLENIRTSLARLHRFDGRTLLMDVRPRAEALLEYLQEQLEPDRMEPAGSYRRGRETVGDLDVLVSGETQGRAGEALKTYPEVEEVMAAGETKTSVLLTDDLQVDVREVPPENFGAALQYFTGSKEHNVRLRERARRRGWTVNEYGLFDEETGEKLAGSTEEGIYDALDLDWIPPELREDHGELEAAEAHDLPDLIQLEDIRGDCHTHTTASDGRDSTESMVDAAEAMGYEYLAITDHSRSLRVADGLSVDELRDHAESIREANERFEIEVLAGTEVDILKDGSLDYPEDVLAELDWVIAAVHTGFDLAPDRQTARIVGAIRHPEVDVLAHPTGRKLGQRDPYDVDRSAILDALVEEGVALEINANGQRLDASDEWCRQARKRGISFVISTDSHARDHLWMMELGVTTARRGWLESTDVLNTRSELGSG